MIDLLQQLCAIPGISGREEQVRRFIQDRLPVGCEVKVDPLGNLLVFKKGKRTPKNKILLTAHMDEVGLIVTGITEDGWLKFSTVGGIDPQVLAGRSVLVGADLPGIIGSKAVHLQTKEQKEQPVTMEELTIDIGAANRDEANAAVHLGDPVCFDSVYTRFGDHKIKGRAIDDRVGCAMLLTLLQQELDFDLYAAFTVQEEVGLRGAAAAAFTIQPDIAIVLETTTASDLAGVEPLKQVCRLGEGPAVPFMDRATLYNRELYELAFAVAEQNQIPCQTKTAVAGGNDAGAISVAGHGAKVLAVSVPCRYLHSPCVVADQRDIVHSYALVQALLPAIEG